MSVVQQILEENYSEDKELASLLDQLSKVGKGVGPPPSLEANITLNPYQTDFLTSPDRGFTEVLYSGSVGGGKSLTLCMALLRYVSIPNTTVLMCRYQLSDLRRSTLKLLLEPEPQIDGSLRPALLPEQLIKSYNKSDGIIYLHNGSQIILTGTKDPEKIRSINASAAIVEEASELSEEMWTAVQQRCRIPCKLPNAVLGATNPKHKGHFLYRRFRLDGIKQRRMITVSAYSNPFLTPQYIQQLEALHEPERSKMLLGEWVDIASAIFSAFDRKYVRDCAHIQNLDACTSFLIGQDFGGGAGYAGAVLLGVGKDGRIYVFDELYKKSITHSQMLKWMEPYRVMTNSTVVYDSANAALKLDMENAGWRCIPCIKDVEGSVGIVNDRFNSDKVVIDSRCVTLISQLEGASRNPNTGLISKLSDWDVVDAFRYGLCALTTSLSEQLTEPTGMLYFIP